MGRKKVNDLITFPMELNMFPYTEEGLAAKEVYLLIITYIQPLNLTLTQNLTYLCVSSFPPPPPLLFITPHADTTTGIQVTRCFNEYRR